MKTLDLSQTPNFVAQDGLWVPESIRRSTCIDFFCGAGGFSLGMLAAGFEVVSAVDNWELAALTYLANLGSWPINLQFATEADGDRLNKCIDQEWKREEKAAKKAGRLPVYLTSGSSGYWQSAKVPPVKTFWFGDVRQMTGQRILASVGMKPGDLDCVVGGPPCQGFSTAGKRDVMDPRNSLVFDFARLILEIQPKTFIMENVPGIINMITPEGMPVIDTFCLMLEEGGYGVADSLKQSLTQNPNARVGMKGHSRSTSSKARTARATAHGVGKQPVAQGDLFR